MNIVLLDTIINTPVDYPEVCLRPSEVVNNFYIDLQTVQLLAFIAARGCCSKQEDLFVAEVKSILKREKNGN